MSGPIRHFVIVGGGTAGWLAALMLRRTAVDHRHDLKITVVEFSKIPTIGVGEGTTAVFKTVLDHLGIDEADFLRETRGTIKYGIRHKDWRRPGFTYDGPIDDPHVLVKGADGSQFLNVFSVAAGRPVSKLHLFDILMKRDLSPYGREASGKLTPVGPFQYAYHIDAAAVGRYLRSKAKGIDIVDATVKRCSQGRGDRRPYGARLRRRRNAPRRFLRRLHRLPAPAHRQGDGRRLDFLCRGTAGQPGDALLARP